MLALVVAQGVEAAAAAMTVGVVVGDAIVVRVVATSAMAVVIGVTIVSMIVVNIIAFLVRN